MINKKQFITACLCICAVLSGCGVAETIPEGPDEIFTTTTSPAIVTEPTTTEPEPVMLDKYVSYYEQNNDTVGWLYIPGVLDDYGTERINYPVLQADDNSYYLDTGFDKQYAEGGWVYADYKVPITATSHADNITIYGHNMKNGDFFHFLHNYKKGVDYVSDHNEIQFSTLYEENKYVIIGAFLTGIYDEQDNLPTFEYFKCRNFETEDDYNYFYQNVMYRSFYDSGVECEYGDEFITLSTCSTEFLDSRFVVVARKLRDGETAEQYADTYEWNSDRHMPMVWYTLQGLEVPYASGPQY